MADDVMPTIYDENAELIPLELFTNITVLPNGDVRMVWNGGRLLCPTRIVNGHGDEMPFAAGACLADQGVLTVAHRKPSKIQATGKLLRGGKVVYDDPVQRAAAKAAGEDVWEPV